MEQYIKKNDKLNGSYLIEFAIKPNAPKNRVYIDYDLLRLDIKAPPTKGKANKAIIKYIAKKLNIPSSNIEIIHGLMSTTKILKISAKSIDKKLITQNLLK